MSLCPEIPLTFATIRSFVSRETTQTGSLDDMTDTLPTVLGTRFGTVLSVISKHATFAGSISDVTETLLTVLGT